MPEALTRAPREFPWHEWAAQVKDGFVVELTEEFERKYGKMTSAEWFRKAGGVRRHLKNKYGLSLMCRQGRIFLGKRVLP